MKYKKIMLILITAIFLVSIAGVCAADANDTMVASEDTAAIEMAQSDEIDEITASDESQTVEQSDDDETVNEENDLDVLSDGTGTWSELRDEIGVGGDINLSKRYYSYDGGGTIEIKNSGVINGNGAVIDMTGSNIRAFYINASDVTINNLTIENANFTGKGGAIYGYGEGGKVSYCSFVNNTADGTGGAICWEDGCDVFSCYFANNTAYEGGAIYGFYGTFFSCYFVNNTADDYGGAIYWQYDGTFFNCTFVNNTADDYGGAIYWYSGGSISYSNFINNTAYEGGAIYWQYVDGGSVSYSNFINNTAEYKGGAIYWEYYSGSVSYSNFINNTAEYGGGAIYWKSESGSISHSTFINDIAKARYIIYTWYDLPVDYCWFGNTAENYDSPPETRWSITCNNWLFLNATANPDTLSVSDTSNIIFKLYLYNSTSGNITEYDNAPFENLNLTITATSGNISKNITKLGEPITYTLTSFGISTITAKIENVEYSIEMDNRVNPDLSLNPQEADYSNSTIIAINYNSSATGTVNITLKGKNGNNYTFTDLTLNATIQLPEAINADEYDVNVTYSGDNAFLNATANGTLTVNKTPAEITVNPASLDLFVGDETVIVANLTPADAGNVTFTSSNVSVVDFDDEGNVIAQGKGQAIITVSFAGDNNYVSAENKTVTVTVSLNNANVTVGNDTCDLKVGEAYAINATKHPDTILLDITYTSSNSSVVTVDEKGIVTAVGEGTAIITVEVGDGEIYAKNSTNITVSVSKVPTEIAANAVTATYNVNKDLVITLKDANGNAVSGVKISVNLNGAKVYTTDKNGQVKVSTSGLVPKVYTATITFDGDNKYIKSTSSVKVTVNKAKPKIVAKKKTYKAKKKTKKFTITLKDNKNKPIKNAKVRLIVKKIKKTSKKKKSKKSKKKYKPNIVKTNKKGKATFKVKRFKKGTYQAKIIYKGNNYYTKVTKTVKIKLK